jgi:hypothetical protein
MNDDPFKNLRGTPTDKKLIEEEMARRLGPPDGICHHCGGADDELPDVGPLRITIDMPSWWYIFEPDCPRRETYTHEFCSWNCLAQWAAIQAGGAFTWL